MGIRALSQKLLPWPPSGSDTLALSSGEQLSCQGRRRGKMGGTGPEEGLDGRAGALWGRQGNGEGLTSILPFIHQIFPECFPCIMPRAGCGEQ